jgi:hypothetical protein
VRVLVACEFSGIVRDAFRNRGHDAWSCDLLPCERPGPHYQCDIRDKLGDDWDLMIAHPPCTDLAVSGARYFKEKQADGRQQAAIDFFLLLATATIPRIAVENPVCIMSRLWRKPDQINQPYQFGHPESKKICLWLKGLLPLQPTQICEPIWMKREATLFEPEQDYKDSSGKRYNPTHYLMGRSQIKRWANTTPSGQNSLPPSADRWKIRSRTYQGIADAMAAQWS